VPATIIDLLVSHLTDCGTQWSLGTFGGIAEFSRDPDEPVKLTTSGPLLSAITSRGSVAITPCEGLRPFASESITRQGWNHRVALCLEGSAATMNRRTALTEFGPDANALREQDRNNILFDLGLDALQSDLCVRIADPDIAARLRDCTGHSVFAADNPAMGIILGANPHRVFLSRIGRIEVYQPIPPATGKSPDGPHTHLLPKLLKSRRTHAATEPIPEGWIPCAHFYPSHPAKDAFGESKTFDRTQHDAFQRLLGTFGSSESISLKKEVIAAIDREQAPFDAGTTRDRVARTDIRVALRQMKVAGHPSRALPAWFAAFDSANDAHADQDELDEQHGS
jgi:hypothetical protein